ncbi:MAG: DUF488 domain-containing protein [Sphingobacteriales bacterium]|nr:MAG: DUF488 domain-containing protein [Sphingobacteriales bacterium]
MTRPLIWTIGHSTRSFDEFLALLRSFAIGQVVDVRHFPGSRKFPQFNKDSLIETLPGAGIAYTHIEALGGRRKPAPDSPNTAWRHPAFRGYADYMATPEFKQALQQLEAIGQASPTAYMCSEAVWWRCHRSMISDALKAAGWNVQHIMDEGKAKEHPYTAPARVVEGRVRYAEK